MPNTALNRTTAALLTNKSGGTLAYGAVVILDNTNTNGFTTTTTAGLATRGIGVILEPNGIANNASGMVAVGGWCPKVTLNTAATVGQFLKTHTVAGQGTPHSSPQIAGDFAVALEASATPPALLFGSANGATSSGLVFLGTYTGSAAAAIEIETRNAAGQSGAIFQSDYDIYVMKLIGVQPATDGAAIWWRGSTDGGGTYVEGTSYDHSRSFNSSAVAGGQGAAGAEGDSKIILIDPADSESTASVNGSYELWNMLNTGLHTVIDGTGTFVHQSNGDRYRMTSTGWWRDTTAVNACEVLASTGNITGTIYMFAYAK